METMGRILQWHEVTDHYDPHPGGMIRETLRRFIPRLEYRELDNCGHMPEIEKHARQVFFGAVREWLETKCAEQEEQ